MLTSPGDSGARLEVEHSLRLEQEEFEREIASYRVWLFGAACGISVVVNFGLHGDFETRRLLPSFYFAICLLYALWIRRAARRPGARHIAWASLVLDLLAVSAIYPIMQNLGASRGTAEAEVGRLFPVYIAAPSLLVVLIINALRYRAAMALAAGGIAVVMFGMVIASAMDLHPAQLPVVTLLLVTGAVGYGAALRARRSLERFARLQLLRRYLAPAAVERVMREDPDAAMSLGGELKTVTLMATDLRGFTAMSEKLAPAEVVRQLNGYHAAVLGPIEAHGGVLDKYIGDGSLIVFGLDPSQSGDHGAADAVRCASEMLAALATHNQERATAGQPLLKMGIGVHTGEVISGNVGAPRLRLDFTVIGDAVNTAARLEGLTKEHGTPVLISAETAARLPAAHGLRPLAQLQIRGRVEPLDVFALPDI